MAPRTGSRTIVFSHANSFPAGTYRVLFEAWREAGYAVHAVERFGHDPRFPVAHDWRPLRAQLIDFLEHEVKASAKAPVYLVGHSLGGFLSTMVASRRPELARGVVMIDSPLFSPLLGGALQLAKFTGVMSYASPGNVSRRRRTHWPSTEAAYEHFARKSAFAKWDERVLRDYITAGTVPSDDAEQPGVTLAFRRDIETRIYNTLPHQLPQTLRAHPLRCPAAFVGGSESTEVRQVGMSETERVTHRRISWVPGSHLFAMERPQETAQAVLRWLAVFAAARDEADQKAA